MKLDKMRTSDKVIARQLKDPHVRAEWDRTEDEKHQTLYTLRISDGTDAATAVLDGQYLTVATRNAYDPNVGDTTFIEALSFDDTYQIEGKVSKRPRKLGFHAGLPPAFVKSGAMCRLGSSAGGR